MEYPGLLVWEFPFKSNVLSDAHRHRDRSAGKLPGRLLSLMHLLAGGFWPVNMAARIRQNQKGRDFSSVKCILCICTNVNMARCELCTQSACPTLERLEMWQRWGILYRYIGDQ